ncbi:MAG: NUDIX domain-containing protein [Candidatus Paceibacterota bacterium]|jgi:isopentenyldiphosphate isomerase
MDEEILDKVDKNDQIIGKTTKQEAHENGYAHRVAAVFVLNDDNKLLVQLRKKDGLLDHSAAGHIRAGESYDHAAARELQEELGLVVPIKKIGIFYSDETVRARNINYVHYFGLYETKPGNDILKNIMPSKEEVAEIIPMTIEEIAKQMLREPLKWTNGFKNTLNFYAKNKNINIPIIPIR